MPVQNGVGFLRCRGAGRRAGREPLGKLGSRRTVNGHRGPPSGDGGFPAPFPRTPPPCAMAYGGQSLTNSSRGSPTRMASPRFPATLRHLVDLTRETLPPLHPAGRPFVVAGA